MTKTYDYSGALLADTDQRVTLLTGRPVNILRIDADQVTKRELCEIFDPVPEWTQPVFVVLFGQELPPCV